MKIWAAKMTLCYHRRTQSKLQLTFHCPGGKWLKLSWSHSGRNRIYVATLQPQPAGVLSLQGLVSGTLTPERSPVCISCCIYSRFHHAVMDINNISQISLAHKVQGVLLVIPQRKLVNVIQLLMWLCLISCCRGKCRYHEIAMFIGWVTITPL